MPSLLPPAGVDGLTALGVPLLLLVAVVDESGLLEMPSSPPPPLALPACESWLPWAVSDAWKGARTAGCVETILCNRMRMAARAATASERVETACSGVSAHPS